MESWDSSLTYFFHLASETSRSPLPRSLLVPTQSPLLVLSLLHDLYTWEGEVLSLSALCPPLISAGPRALGAIDTLTLQLPLQTRPDLPNSRLTAPLPTHTSACSGHLELSIDYHSASPNLSLLHCSGQSSVPSRTPPGKPSLTLLFLSPPSPSHQ